MRYPLSEFTLQLPDEISTVEIVDSFEGHRQPTFQVVSENCDQGDQVSITITFTVPFQVEEHYLVEHLILTIQEQIERENRMGQHL